MSLLRQALRVIRSMFQSLTERNEHRSQCALSSTPAFPDPGELRSFVFHCGDHNRSVFYVEFVGGPLDGHRDGLPISPEELAVTIAIPVSPTHIAKLSDTLRPIIGSPAQPTSVAFYERDLACQNPPRFVFVTAARIEDVRSLWANQA